MEPLRVEDLHRIGYAEAYAHQRQTLEAVLAARATGAVIGRILLVEHDPVITVTKRAGAAGHVLAGAEALGRMGIGLAETDRGGDVTYHGPGQVVVYPIIDLNRVHCRLHEYLRLLEQSVIDTLARFGVIGERDATATGVWVRRGNDLTKVCAIGVRVSRWITMHGLALNVDPDLTHFGMIVPCGLHGRPVSSLRELLGDRCPTTAQVKAELSAALTRALTNKAAEADRLRSAHAGWVTGQGASVPGGDQR